MTSRFHIMHDPRFRLVHQVTQRFSDGPDGGQIRLARTGFTLDPAIKKKAEVYPAMLIATHPAPDTGNLYSPVRGVVSDVSERYVDIDVKPAQPDDPVMPVVDLSSLEGDALLEGLKNMGVDTRSLSQSVDTLIINALNPEPGIMWAEPMLATHVRNLKLGLELHQRISKAHKVIIALPKGMNAAYEGLEVAHIEPEYPNSLDPLVIKAITGKENPPGVGIVGLHALWGLGRVMVTGQPLTETVVTVASCCHTGNYIIKDGTRVCDLFEHANVTVEKGDTVVVGGPLRGQSISLLARGLDKHTTGVFVVEADSIPPLDGDSQCVNCGACALVCPARLASDMLSRYAEFAKYDRCRAGHIEACMECGLCGYVCIARRPVLQYIRLAKHKLALEDNRLA